MLKPLVGPLAIERGAIFRGAKRLQKNPLTSVHNGRESRPAWNGKQVHQTAAVVVARVKTLLTPWLRARSPKPHWPQVAHPVGACKIHYWCARFQPACGLAALETRPGGTSHLSSRVR
jgi:hypothetical protein